MIATLLPLGDYLREHKMVTGCGFERTGEGIVCRFQNCRFANVAHKIAEGGVGCAQCPVFQLIEEVLAQRASQPSLLDHAVLLEEDVTCVFHIDLLSGHPGREGKEQT
jgi:hypothetical protein